MFDNKLFIITYFIFIGMIAVFVGFQKQHFLKKYDETLVLIIESLFIFVFLSIFYIISGEVKDFSRQLTKISKKDMLVMIAIPLFFTFTTIIGAKILKANDISYLTILDTVIDVILTFMIAYLFYEEKLSLKKILSIGLVLGGITIMH
jgi:uncharacterized membrane protein